MKFFIAIELVIFGFLCTALLFTGSVAFCFWALLMAWYIASDIDELMRGEEA